MEYTLEDLNEYIIENIGMEIMDDRIESVVETIKGWENAIISEDLKIIEELKKFKEYSCLYSIDAEHGGVWGQGYVIVDKDLNYIDFVRTI